ncbi:MAG: hypothetical protein EOO67_11980, partial [Microbacterium sp.]
VSGEGEEAGEQELPHAGQKVGGERGGIHVEEIGDLAVGVLIDAIADLLDVDAAALAADLLPRVRELLFTGFLAFS